MGEKGFLCAHYMSGSVLEIYIQDLIYYPQEAYEVDFFFFPDRKLKIRD